MSNISANYEILKQRDPRKIPVLPFLNGGTENSS